ncbi:hypothetical protein [Mesorhizobium amorphae]|nr:hypothetical protein [Mesorhizobium amorphae]
MALEADYQDDDAISRNPLKGSLVLITADDEESSCSSTKKPPRPG